MLRTTRSTFPDDATDEESALVRAHFEHLQLAMDESHLLIAGRTLGISPIGMIVVRMRDIEAATRFMESDPAVRAGIFTATVEPFRIALMHESVVALRELEANLERKRLGI